MLGQRKVGRDNYGGRRTYKQLSVCKLHTVLPVLKALHANDHFTMAGTSSWPIGLLELLSRHERVRSKMQHDSLRISGLLRDVETSRPRTRVSKDASQSATSESPAARMAPGLTAGYGGRPEQFARKSTPPYCFPHAS